MTSDLLYRLRDDVALSRRETWHVLATPENHLRLRADEDGTSALLEALRAEWLAEEQLATRFACGAPEVEWQRFYFLFHKLLGQRFLQVQTQWKGEPLCIVTPAPAQPPGYAVAIDPRRTYRLSRFAYMHQEGGQMHLESPLASHQCRLCRPELAQLLCQLATGFTPAQPGPSEVAAEPMTGVFLETLVSLGLAEGSPDAEARTSPDLRFWEFHDLLFHMRSHEGRHSYPVGGTYRFQKERGPLPPVKPPIAGETIPLPAPNESARQKLSRPLAEVLDCRRSIRKYAADPLDTTDLGAFLFAAARVQRMAPALSHFTETTDLGAVTFRPSPSGGAAHPLEIYPLLRECRGLDRGLYHYQPDRHALVRLEAADPGLERLRRLGRFDLMGFDEAPLILLITARFGRTAWKYQSIAYRLVQNDLGCLYQTLYLVATALDLAPCALGAVNPDAFAAATGIDVYAEPLVGAFTLGRRHPD